MRIAGLNTKQKVIITAEIGNNHEGDFALAQRMVEEAAKAGADIVKFQTIRADKFTSPKNQPRHANLKKFELSDQQFAQLAQTAKDNGVLFMSTPFDLEGVYMLNKIAPAFKIASGDNTFYPLISEIVRIGKPIILSSGFLLLSELVNIVHFIEEEARHADVPLDLAILHCVVAYPTPAKDANLGAIRELERTFTHTVGYSDHVIGIDSAVLAVAAGARIIEKHFTIDNNYSAHRDHQLSLNPADFKTMVERVRTAEELIGLGEKIPQESERLNLIAVRRSIVAARNLPAGHQLQLKDLSWMRPGDGVAPGDEESLVGRKLVDAIEIGEKITRENTKVT